MIFVYATLSVLALVVFFLIDTDNKRKKEIDYDKSNTYNSDTNVSDTNVSDTNVSDTNHTSIDETIQDINPFKNEDFVRYFLSYTLFVTRQKTISKKKTREYFIGNNIGAGVFEEKLIDSIRKKFQVKLNGKYETENFTYISQRIRGIVSVNGEKLISFDLHELSLSDAKKLFELVYAFCKANQFDFMIIHGYNKGTAIKDFISNYPDNFYKKECVEDNLGVTIFFVIQRTKKSILEKEEDFVLKYNKKLQDSESIVEKKMDFKKENLDCMQRMLIKNRIITNVELLNYFLSSLNERNYRILPRIYGVLYKLSPIQRSNFSDVFLLCSHQSSKSFITKYFIRALQLWIKYNYSKYGNKFEFDTFNNLDENFSVTIETVLLRYMLNYLVKNETEYTITSILIQYSKLDQKQKDYIYNYIFRIDNGEQSVQQNDALDALKLLADGDDNSYYIFNNTYKLNTVRDIYIHKLLVDDSAAKKFLNLSDEQHQWYLWIKRKIKAYYQIPLNILDDDFKQILYADFGCALDK